MTVTDGDPETDLEIVTQVVPDSVTETDGDLVKVVKFDGARVVKGDSVVRLFDGDNLADAETDPVIDGVPDRDCVPLDERQLDVVNDGDGVSVRVPVALPDVDGDCVPLCERHPDVVNDGDGVSVRVPVACPDADGEPEKEALAVPFPGDTVFAIVWERVRVAHPDVDGDPLDERHRDDVGDRVGGGGGFVPVESCVAIEGRPVLVGGASDGDGRLVDVEESDAIEADNAGDCDVVAESVLAPVAAGEGETVAVS